MENPHQIKQEFIENLLENNKPVDVFNYIISLLKGDNKNDIYLKLLSINYLNFISGEFFLPRREEFFLIKSLSQSEKLIKELKSYKSDELNEFLLNDEAYFHANKFRFNILKGDNYLINLEKHLQLSITNYWKSLRICESEEEKYNIRNNIANGLVDAGRFIEAISLLNQNIIQSPNRFQSIASWGDAMERLKFDSNLPDIPSFYFKIAEKYIEAKKIAPNLHVYKDLEGKIERCRLRLATMGLDLNNTKLKQNRDQEQEEFQKFSEYRKYILVNELSPNEHSLHCYCANAEHDNLSIGLYGGSIHLYNKENLKKQERYLNRIKSEYSFARLLYYKYCIFENSESDFYFEDDYKNTTIHNDNEILGYRVEHIRTSYRIIYGILDKIASAVLLHYNIPENGKSVYFEDVFHQFNNQLLNKENIHLYALRSMSLDLSQSLNGIKVGSLGFYKKIRNKLEHGLLIISTSPTNLENMEVSILDFESYIVELLRLTRSAIFSLTYLIRTESFVKKL